MTIAYPVAFPTIDGKTIVENFTMRIVQSAAITQSATSFSQQVQDFNVARWEAEITIRPLDYEEAKVFSAFLASLRGITKTFTFGDPQQNYATNVPVCATTTGHVSGSNAISIQNSSNHALIAGSHFSLAGRLHVLLEDAPANTTQTCEIAPPLRVTTAANSLDVTQPTGLWRLASNDIEWSVGRESLHRYTLACVESI